MLYVLLFVAVVSIIAVIAWYLLKLYGIDAGAEIKKVLFEAKKEVEVDADDEFNEMYNSLRKKYEKSEKKVRNLSSLIAKAEIVLIIILILCIFISIINQIFLLLITFDLTIAIILVILKENLLRSEKRKLKKQFIENFVKDINEGFMFDENGELSERSYKLSGFDRAFNIFESKNYLEGFLDDDTKIMLAEIKVKHEKKIENKRIIENKFEGTFGYANINKKFTEAIKLLNKKEQITSTEVVSEKNSKKFKDVFDVFADEDMFREIFDKQLIKTIMGYIKNFDINLEIIIEGSNIYFRFYNKDLISHKNFGSNEEKLCLWKYYCMIQLIYIIVDRINNL